jgi:hypothetical protein
MKVSLTGEEFKAILSCHMRCEVTGFTIVDPDPSPLGNLIRGAVVNPLDKSFFVSNLKLLRRALIMRGDMINLLEARWAIENWLDFLRFVDQYNRLPISGYGSGDEKGKLK